MLENFLLFIEPFVEMLILKYICMSVKKISVSYRRALSSFFKLVKIWLGELNLLMGQPSC